MDAAGLAEAKKKSQRVVFMRVPNIEGLWHILYSVCKVLGLSCLKLTEMA